MAAQTNPKRERSASPDAHDAASASRRTSDAPEAKRVKDERTMSGSAPDDTKPPAAAAAPAAGAADDKDAVDLAGNEADDAAAPAPSGADGENGDKQAQETAEGDAAAAGDGSAPPDGLEPQHIAMRSLIVTGDASVIIGKQGRHINEIRDKSGARLTIVSGMWLCMDVCADRLT